jgi:hypothetical protein
MNSEEDNSLSALESCRAAEAKIQDAQRLLLGTGPEGLDRCLHELDQATALLETVVSSGPYSPARHPKGAALLVAFRRIQRLSQLLRLQIGFSSNFWRGWLQRRAGAGYTERGQPVFADHGSRSFEG